MKKGIIAVFLCLGMLLAIPVSRGNEVLAAEASPTEMTMGEVLHAIEANPTSYRFSFMESGYVDPPFVEIAFKNVGTETLFLNKPVITSGNYDIEIFKTRLAAEETTGITIRPKMDLPAGNYDDVLSITATNGASTDVEIFLNIYDPSQSYNQGKIAFGDKIYFGTDGEKPNK